MTMGGGLRLSSPGRDPSLAGHSACSLPAGPESTWSGVELADRATAVRLKAWDSPDLVSRLSHGDLSAEDSRSCPGERVFP